MEGGADMVAVPGGASGLLVRDYKRRQADRLVTRIDPGVLSLVAGLRGHERQAAEELGQWKSGVEERKPLDASPATRAARYTLSPWARQALRSSPAWSLVYLPVLRRHASSRSCFTESGQLIHG
jgi:hypothetical protein